MSGRVSDPDDTNEKKYVTFKVHHEDPFRFTIAYTDESPDELYEQFMQKIASIGRPVGKLYVDRGSDHMLISNARDLKNAMEGCDLMNIHATVADTDIVTSRTPFYSGGDESVRRRYRRHRRHSRNPSPECPRMCYQPHGRHGLHGCPAFADETFPWGPCSFYGPHFGQFGCNGCCCHREIPYSCCCSF